MRIALLNPRWSFEGSIYFGCREPHLPLELGYCRALLPGHQTLMLDGRLDDLTHGEMAVRLADFRPDMTVVTTAPTYLFWRCAQPELRVPQDLVALIRPVAGRLVAVGPHGSTSPGAVRRKLGVDEVVMGECEEIVARLADGGTAPPVPHTGRFTDLPPLSWPAEWLARHTHHHHRFDAPPDGPGAEIEASRGCPYRCSFCAKEAFRDAYRRRALGPLLAEIDGLIAQGVTYLYFIDEIFLPDRRLLEALVDRPVRFGVQTRIDLWKPEYLELLGRAGCVSIEAGVESLSEAGRDRLDKDCRMSTDELGERLVLAKRHVPFVQANLIEGPDDDQADLIAWRRAMRAQGVWANDPVPLFPYPGAPDYRKRWGPPDDLAWERAVDDYLARFDHFSDIQEERPLPLHHLERSIP
ncbi:MAG: TIGR04295 family B12-binding domain-containing radical SAM protein [Alphaproteobacteria bacterium]|nr:TIGR04295 family B12-binding domain-containing radical SAM protein [Alphaproteobacteria bacterium]